MGEPTAVQRAPPRGLSTPPAVPSVTQRAVASWPDASQWGKLPDTVTQVIAGLVAAIEVGDRYTYGHSLREAGHAVALAQEMGLPAQQVEDIRWGTLLHDIGKLFIGERILRKRDELTEDEFEGVRKHAALGAAMMSRVEPLKDIAKIVRHHHERFDGSGYPDGLADDRIPLGARVVSVVDAFGAMIEERPYRRMLTLEEALAELERGAGGQFDPRMVEVFVALARREGMHWLKIGCCLIECHSAPVSGPGFWRMESGIPILPKS